MAVNMLRTRTKALPLSVYNYAGVDDNMKC